MFKKYNFFILQNGKVKSMENFAACIVKSSSGNKSEHMILLRYVVHCMKIGFIFINVQPPAKPESVLFKLLTCWKAV